MEKNHFLLLMLADEPMQTFASTLFSLIHGSVCPGG
jgi:hypothetical protein